MARKKSILRPLALIAAVLAAVLSAGCATNPVTGKKNLALISEKEELVLGQKNDVEVRKQYGVYQDEALQEYVRQIGQRVAANSHRPGLSYQVTVLDSADVNAFALPGGYVYITRGIMAYLNSEAELAAVLGHEIGHVTARHGVRQYSAAIAANLGYQISSIFIPGLAAGGQSLFNLLGGALLSGYGREHELEADRLGAEYLARNDYDPEAMIKVIGVLKNQEVFEKQLAAEEGRPPRSYHGVFASHPSADQRLQQVVAEAKKFKTGNRGRAERDIYLDHLNRMAFGDSAQEGVRRGHNFYHKDLDFALSFPAGWRLENRPQTIDAVSPQRDAVMQVMLKDIGEYLPASQFMQQRLKLTNLTQGQTLTIPDAKEAYTAITRLKTPFGSGDARVTVVYIKDKAFIFFAAAKSKEAWQTYDRQFLDTAGNLHRLTPAEKALAEPLRIQFVTARAGDTFAELARGSRIPLHAEAMLRLLNDKYPQGEPAPGEKIKVVR